MSRVLNWNAVWELRWPQPVANDGRQTPDGAIFGRVRNMQASSQGPGPQGSAGARLTRAQKRDLLGMCAAAVITTALMAVPAVLPLVDGTHHDQQLAEPVHDAPMRSIPITPVVVVAQPVRVAHVEVVPPAIEQTAVPLRRRLRATSLPPAIRVTGLPLPAIASGPAPTILATTMGIERPSRPLARKLAGFLTGDGTYSVRPFPTVTAGRH